MIRTRRAVACGAALLASALAATLAAVPAQADDPGWRVVEAGPNPGWDDFGTVATSSKRNAWVFGGVIGDTPPMRPIAKRWVDGAWRNVALPDEVVGYIDAASTTSAQNVWAIADHGDAGPSYALRWDGSAWTSSHRWEEGLTSDVITTGRRDVWVFGYSRAGAGVGTWHFDGSRWRQADVGDLLLERGSAVSARDIWAVGATRSTGCGDRTVAHYDGRRWRSVPVGDALPPDIPQPDEGGPYQCVHLRDVLATSRHDVWVTGNLYRSDGTEQHEERPVLAHWDGRTWRSQEIPGTWIPNRLASDGRGGLWITGWDDSSGPTPEATPLMHRAADGTWRTATIDAAGRPARIRELALIPGTRSLWGVGLIENPEEIDGAIYRYR
ncbi:hypothetical protein E1287_40510 [Actinomadura sp. KC06]|uniref:hypothetical protein n=1 Tax=Actinomadura sp. KC06 TaxID=2530369 RepID=UPI00104FF9A6|nr:hypothetical protein [Actinomadura sp. KC06]TDD21537.1 hypothetical protein E1287_40510 [Actinomadura sp. KC06]